jgi:sugar-specific transcriptional regulator TrmB
MEVLNDLLKHAGLEEIESRVYTTLLDNGALTVLELSVKADLKRTNLYNVLETLESKGLVKKVTDSKSIKYFPQSPREIHSSERNILWVTAFFHSLGTTRRRKDHPGKDNCQPR